MTTEEIAEAQAEARAEGERVSIELDRDAVDALLWIIYPQLKKRYPDAVDVFEDEDEAPEGEEIKEKGEK